MQTNAAYDLERFAPREQKPRLRVAGQPKPKRGLARYNLKWIKAVAFASVYALRASAYRFRTVWKKCR